jgi:hypothetical protein
VEINATKATIFSSLRQPMRFFTPVYCFPGEADCLQSQVYGPFNDVSFHVVKHRFLDLTELVALWSRFAMDERISAVFEITEQRLEWRLSAIE